MKINVAKIEIECTNKELRIIELALVYACNTYAHNMKEEELAICTELAKKIKTIPKDC